ncbi:MAG: MFS transporter [Erysipelotrichaceae bacterium]
MKLSNTTRNRILLSIIYLSFISLGLPDGSLGISWPLMRLDFNQPIEAAGLIILITLPLSALSSIYSHKLSNKLGIGKVTFLSALLTASSLLGIGFSKNYTMLVFFSIGLGLGQGAVDSLLNSYVAKHYSSRHMTWLHGFWGVGATLGPTIMTTVLKFEYTWSLAYFSLSTLQYIIAFILFLSLGFWLNDTNNTSQSKNRVQFDYRMLYGIALFFLYVGIELSVGLWTNSYLVEEIGLLPSVSGYIVASYYASIMSGRFLSGFISNRLGNRNMIRLGLILSGIGSLLLILFRDLNLIRLSLILIGLGFAPLYPSMMHETPKRFISEQANMLISYQVGIAYIGGTIISTGLGYLFKPFGLSILYPIIMCFILVMVIISEIYNRVTPKQGH